jgi:hypothetical protein
MSPTLLEVLVFLFAIRAVPIVIEQLSHYFDRTFTDDTDEKESGDYER